MSGFTHPAFSAVSEQQTRLRAILCGRSFLFPQLNDVQRVSVFVSFIVLSLIPLLFGATPTNIILRLLFFLILTRMIFTFIWYYKGIVTAKKKTALSQLIAGLLSLFVGHVELADNPIAKIVCFIVLFVSARALVNYLAYGCLYLSDEQHPYKGLASGRGFPSWDDIFFDSMYIMKQRDMNIFLIPALLFVLAVSLMSYSPISEVAFENNLLQGISFVGLLLATRTFRFARRIRQPSVERLLESDKRRPVLFLRPFVFDTMPLTPAPNEWRAVLSIFSTREITIEEELAKSFREIGPFVAIGRPGELAARWEHLANTFLERAGESE